MGFLTLGVVFKTETYLLLLKSVLIIGSEDSRLWAAEELGEKKEEGLSGLVIALEDPNVAVRISASVDISNLEEKAKNATPNLIAALNDQRESIRVGAAHTLGKIGSSADQKYRGPLIKALAKTAIYDSSPIVRGKAAEVLDDISRHSDWPELKHAREIFSAAATSSNLYFRGSAFISYSLTNPKLFPNPSVLLGGLQDTSDTVRKYAANCLGRQKANPNIVVPALIKVLSDKDPDVRMYAVIALGKFGPEAKVAVPLILKTTLKDIHEHQYLAPILKKIGLEFALPLLKNAEKSNDVAESKAATSLLKELNKSE